MIPFTVCICVYHRDNYKYFKEAVESVTTRQIVKPNEVVIVVDGPIYGSLKEIVEAYEKDKDLFKVIWLPENRGLGNALHLGVEEAGYNYIARMDSDDIADPNRFEKQIQYLKENPSCDIIGGQIAEFIDDATNIVGKRTVPIENSDIYCYLKSRCPFNHMTVVFKKDAVLKVGNYLDWHFNEDYYLWIRMAEAGCKFANLPDTLVNVRVGKDMYRRRGGWKYFKSEAKLQRYMLTHKIISLPRYIYNVTGRLIVQVSMPNWLRGFVFQKLFRK